MISTLTDIAARLQSFLWRHSKNGWLALDQGGISVLNFATVLLLAQALEQETFGVFVIVYGLLAFASNVLFSAFFRAHNVIGPSMSGLAYKRFTASLLMMALFCSAAFVLILAVASMTLKPLVGPTIAQAGLALSVALVPWLMQDGIRRVMYTEGRVKSSTINNLIAFGLQVLAIGLLVQRDVQPSLMSILALLGASSGIAFVVGLYQVRNSLEFHRLSASVFRRSTHRAWSYGRWLTRGEVVNVAGHQGQTWFIAALLGPQMVAIYGVASYIVRFLSPLNVLCSNHLPIAASRQWSQSTRSDFMVWFRRTGLLLTGGFAILVLLLAIGAQPMLGLFFGPEYATDLTVALVILLATSRLIGFAGTVMASGLMAIKQTRQHFESRVLSVVVSVVATPVLLMTIGLIGLPVSRIIIFGITAAFLVHKMRTWYKSEARIQFIDTNELDNGPVPDKRVHESDPLFALGARYRLGRGGEATVFAMADQETALKVYDGVNDANDRSERVQEEFLRLGSTSHLRRESAFLLTPQPVRVDAELGIIIVERIHGPSLLEYILNQENPDIHEHASRLARGIMELARANRRCAMDVTLSNVLVDTDNTFVNIDTGDTVGVLSGSGAFWLNTSLSAFVRKYVAPHLVGQAIYAATRLPLRSRARGVIQVAQFVSLVHRYLNQLADQEAHDGGAHTAVITATATVNHDTTPAASQRARLLRLLSRASERLFSIALRAPVHGLLFAFGWLVSKVRNRPIIVGKLPTPHRLQNAADGNHLLACAYVCKPDAGSESAVAWDTIIALSDDANVTVLTRSTEKRAFERGLIQASPMHQVSAEYVDVPPAMKRLFNRMGRLGMELELYTWSHLAGSRVRALQKHTRFDAGIHVSIARYWMPSPLAWFDGRFVFGPVGGGESAPPSLFSMLSIPGRLELALRSLMRWIGERLPSSRRTARNAAVCFGTTDESSARLRGMGATCVKTLPAVSWPEQDHSGVSIPDSPPVFASVGRLLEWKGTALSIRALAFAKSLDAQLLIIGNGPRGNDLMRLASDLEVSDRVQFIPWMKRGDLLALMPQLTALLHPSLHDSGGYVCLEAMAAGVPVVCLAAGGPAELVGTESRLCISPSDAETTAYRMADIMDELILRPDQRALWADEAQQRAHGTLSTQSKVKQLFDALGLLDGSKWEDEKASDRLSSLPVRNAGRPVQKPLRPLNSGITSEVSA